MKKSLDPKTRLFMGFFGSEMGAKFVDADTKEPVIDDSLSLCENCYCMTRTHKSTNTCLKCGAEKGKKNG